MAASQLAPADFRTVSETRQYINWPAVFAGNAITGGLILVMLPLGAAAGLAMTSAYPGNSAAATTLGWTAVLWLAFMYLSSVFAGGYVVGRLRPRVGDSNLDEVYFRDGMNGLVFWGVGMIVSALFTFLTVSSAVGTATSAVGQAVAGAATSAGNALTANTDYISDLLLRQAPSGGAIPSGQPSSDTELRSQIGRILTAGAASGAVNDQDRQYVAALVAQRTGLSEGDARARVDEGIKRANEMKEQAIATAQATAEGARKAAAQLAFWTALLSLVAGLAAIFAARLGGQHRDATTAAA